MTALDAPRQPCSEHGKERIGKPCDQGGGKADAPEPVRFASTERADQIDPQAIAPAATEFGQDGAENRIGGGDPQTGENGRQGASELGVAQDLPAPATIGPDDVDRAARRSGVIPVTVALMVTK